MYKDYVDELVKHYHSLKEKGRLAPRLINPTPTSIKEECISLFELRHSKRDMPILLTFFRIVDEQELRRAIAKSDRDRFRPLANFLVGRTVETENPNIDLLAWLIDFQRPYRLGLNLHTDPDYADEEILAERGMGGSSSEREKISGQMRHEFEGVVGQREIAGIAEEEGLDYYKKGKRDKTMWIISVLAGVTFLLGIAFWHSLIDLFTGNKYGCMIWVGDRFAPEQCGIRRGDTVSIPFDRERMNNFKRILRPDIDTITYYSIGKLFYFLREGQVEVYTQYGKHPVYQERYLKPLTSTIIDNHIRFK